MAPVKEPTLPLNVTYQETAILRAALATLAERKVLSKDGDIVRRDVTAKVNRLLMDFPKEETR